MRKIAERYTLVDERGYAWDCQVTVPWPDKEKSHGPETPLVTINTPDEPQHWAFGEPGVTFSLGALKRLVELGMEARGREVPK